MSFNYTEPQFLSLYFIFNIVRNEVFNFYIVESLDHRKDIAPLYACIIQVLLVSLHSQEDRWGDQLDAVGRESLWVKEL